MNENAKTALMHADEANSAEIAHETSLSARAVVRVVLLIIAVLFAVVLLGALVYWLSSLILLIILAIFFAYLLAPLVDLIQRPFNNRNQIRWMPRPLAIGIVYFLLAATLYAAGTYLLPFINEQVSQFASQAPTYITQLTRRRDELVRRYQRSIPPALRETLENSLTPSDETVSEYVRPAVENIVVGSVTLIPSLILIPILGFFFLKDAQLFQLAAVRAFPRGQLRGRAELFLQDLNKTLRAYTRAQLISCALIGTVCTIAFYVIGVPYALLLGIVAAILEFIPLVGPLIVGVLATTIASFDSGQKAFTVAIFLLVLRVVHDYVTYPRIVREGIHLHPLAIVLAVLAGEEVGGITGIFLAIPVVAVVTVAYRHLMEHRGSTSIVADLLDEGKTDKAIDVAEKQLAVIHEKAEQELRPSKR